MASSFTKRTATGAEATTAVCVLGAVSAKRKALLRRRIAANAVERRIVCECGPNPARENAGDLLVVGLGEGGHEIIAGGRQSEVISEEEIAGGHGDSLHIERAVREAN